MNNNQQLKQKIKERAYEIFQKRLRNNKPGAEASDWLIAECEILAEEEWKIREQLEVS